LTTVKLQLITRLKDTNLSLSYDTRTCWTSVVY